VATVLTILFLPALYALWFSRSLDATSAETSHEDARSDELPAADSAESHAQQRSAAGAAGGQPAHTPQILEHV
jgi:hypothetical protein